MSKIIAQRARWAQVGCTCMILVKDAEATIADCLNSALSSGCFTRIAILWDDRTRDRTGSLLIQMVAAAVAAGAPIEIYRYRWGNPPDFAAARNYLITKVRTRYAFWLDDDEKLIKPTQLRAMLQRARGQAFQMWVRSPMPGGGSFDMYQPRLFPVVPGAIFEVPVYECIHWSLKRIGVHIEQTSADPISHPGYLDNRIVSRKNERNSRILKKAIHNYQGGPEQRAHLIEQYRAVVG